LNPLNPGYVKGQLSRSFLSPFNRTFFPPLETLSQPYTFRIQFEILINEETTKNDFITFSQILAPTIRKQMKIKKKKKSTFLLFFILFKDIFFNLSQIAPFIIKAYLIGIGKDLLKQST